MIYLQNLNQIEFPDACFGLGYIGDLIKFRDEKDYKKEFPEILFAVSWKNLIRLFLLNETLDQIVEIGWYMNNCSIIKIDFIFSICATYGVITPISIISIPHLINLYLKISEIMDIYVTTFFLPI